MSAFASSGDAQNASGIHAIRAPENYPSHMKIIAIAGRKGGAGKTSLTLALASHYARAKKRVCVVDLDPQASATMLLRAPLGGAHLLAVVEGKALPEPVPVEYWEHLNVLRGGPEMERARPAELRPILSKLDAEVVLLDCPPGVSILDVAALTACDCALVASEPHSLAIAGAVRVLNVINKITHSGESIHRAVVLSRVDARRAIDRDAADQLKDTLKVPVFCISQDTALAAALNGSMRPPAKGKAAEDLKAVVKWLQKQSPRQ